jgi:hypothetical protein
VVRALTEHGGTLMLADCRDMRVVKQLDQEWFDRYWLPRALAAGLGRIAVVNPKSGLALMNLDAMVERAPHTATEVRHFATVEAAREWLASRLTPAGVPEIKPIP